MAKRGRERERGRCVVKGRGHVYTEVGGVVVGQGVWYGRKWSWMRHVCMCVYMCGVGVCEAWTSAVANSRWLVLFSLDRRGGGGGHVGPYFSPGCVGGSPGGSWPELVTVLRALLPATAARWPPGLCGKTRGEGNAKTPPNGKRGREGGGL